MNTRTRNQSGFTLVEIAIVLVIIGLLLGGVLKGQAMIENGKVKALTAELRSVATMMNGYRDMYKALPGDDPAAVAHLGTPAVQATGVIGNGKLDSGKWIGLDAPDAANETSVFWQHVRLAGLATGASTSGTASNALGGKLGVTSNTDRPTAPANITGSFYVCTSGLSGKLARAIDIAMDDGAGDTGQMFGGVETGGAPVTAALVSTAYVDTSSYTVCMAQ